MKKRVAKTFNLSILTVGALLLGSLPLIAQDSPKSIVNQAVSFGVSAPVKQLAKLPVRHGLSGDYPLLRGPRRAAGSGVVEQRFADDQSNFTIDVTTRAIGWGFPNFNAAAAKRSFPDTNIAVGDSQIVQAADSSYAVFDKSTGVAFTPAMPIRTLWQSVGGACSKSSSFFGNAIVQWDKAASQWLIAINVLDQYSGPFYACIAISTSDDALGTWYVYQFLFSNGGYPDQMRLGVWTPGGSADSYFQSQDNFGPHPRLGGFVGAEPCAYDRDKMLLGDPMAEQVCFQLSSNDFALLPGDVDSPTPPPTGQDELLFSLWDTSHLALYSFHVDWTPTLSCTTPPCATITGNDGSQLIDIPPYNAACNGQFLGFCVPQQNSFVKLEVLGDRLLYRLVYYNDNLSSSQHWLVLHDVQTDAAQGSPQAERWYEFTAPQMAVDYTGLSLLQSGTYAPDSNNRWMGSIARDSSGNIMMGYSESSSKLRPSIAITGRLVSDPLNWMEAEQFVFFPPSPQKDSFGRWGEYTSMRLDPDGCTLWYTSEYYLIPVPLDWDTEISSATFAPANCTPAP
ncbi:MAG TPA: hypothetical protein VKG65_02650 [Terriglobales bacterium]|nr:hypothetical protein [Terriglobales bacterium]